MCYEIEQVQSYLSSLDKMSEEMPEHEERFCDSCGCALEVRQEFTCEDCLEEGEENKVFSFEDKRMQILTGRK